MSTWTHVTGAIRIDDMNKVFHPALAIDLSKIFKLFIVFLKFSLFVSSESLL